MNYLRITGPDIENGLGFRVTLWISGCSLGCPGCQNHMGWDFKAGKEFTDETYQELVEKLNKPYIKGLTLSGGNPSESPEVVNVIKCLKNDLPEKDIWLFSGFTLEELKEQGKTELLGLIDVLVDGRFILSERDTSLAFRGSRNQIIWMKDPEGNFVKMV